MSKTTTHLSVIPVLDVRDGGPVRHARESAEQARALRDACLACLPRISHPATPMLDAVTRRWLVRSRSPYVDQIAAIAAELKMPGVWLLNGSYQWGCTALAREHADVPWLARTLDWPFPGLGRHAEVARMAGPAGEFLNVTWPGFVGALTAMAPGRFAASLNQAPLWRRTRHPWLRAYDLAVNAIGTWSLTHIPPDHLLRQVFEDCATFAEAKQKLETTAIARPAIFTLAGCRKGELCVIERSEEGCSSRHHETSAANDWLLPLASWEARVGANIVWTCSYDEAGERSRRRREALAGWNGSILDESFGWVAPPVLNRYTRLAVEMCPANDVLRVVGYEFAAGEEWAHPVTLPREVACARVA